MTKCLAIIPLENRQKLANVNGALYVYSIVDKFQGNATPKRWDQHDRLSGDHWQGCLVLELLDSWPPSPENELALSLFPTISPWRIQKTWDVKSFSKNIAPKLNRQGEWSCLKLRWVGSLKALRLKRFSRLPCWSNAKPIKNRHPLSTEAIFMMARVYWYFWYSRIYSPFLRHAWTRRYSFPSICWLDKIDIQLDILILAKRR